ncbi:AMP-binding protein [Streptomyces sp. NPDC002405]|uniref:AMP-binding protein n=1 Tax=Streptomyces sp. NPDC001231 TaxID=3364549 RepID=UPI0036B5394A
MTGTWTTAGGAEVPDRVPARLRRRYVEQGLVPGRDLSALFRAQATAHPERPAVIDPEGTLGYAALDRRARRIAAALTASGVGAGDVVGVQLPNGWRALAADLALAAIGAVALPYPVGRGRRDSLALLGGARAGAVITTAEWSGIPLARVLSGLRADLPCLRTVAVLGPAPDGCVPLDPWLACSTGSGTPSSAAAAPSARPRSSATSAHTRRSVTWPACRCPTRICRSGCAPA